MKPGKFDLDMYRGDSYSWRFILWEDEEKLTPVDLTDANVAAEIKDKHDGTVALSLTCVISLPNIIDVTMSPDMYANCPKKGVWDMQVTSSIGEVHTPIAGNVTVTSDVTESV